MRIEKFKKLLKRIYLELPIFYVLVLAFSFSFIFVPAFASKYNIINIFVHTADLVILSIALTFVLLNGSIDFSITAVVGFGSVVAALLTNKDTGLFAGSPMASFFGIAVIIAIGLLIGVLNGFAVVILKMPSFMATMATYMIFSGLALYISQSETITNLPSGFLFFGEGKIFSIPFPIVLSVGVFLISFYVLSKTVFGRSVYAVGTNPKTAFISGIPVKKLIFSLFVICGFLASIGAIVMTARVGAGMPALGQERLLDIVAAVILGGTSLFGGVGSVVGTILGAFFITVMNNSLNLLGINWYVIDIIKGFIILIVALLDARRQTR
jgi:ribose/xylose/arabinose/galactoside ABC-type transport system permease subunit